MTNIAVINHHFQAVGKNVSLKHEEDEISSFHMSGCVVLYVCISVCMCERFYLCMCVCVRVCVCSSA